MILTLILDYFSMVNNGWEYETGFLSNVLQVTHENEYYQRFAYAIKSRVSLINGKILSIP